MNLTKEENKKLCEQYPFLIPSNRWSGKRITEGAGFWPAVPDAVPKWDYEYTELDNMPDGWRTAFGHQFCEELKDALEHSGVLETYRITQIKEKFGTLRIYDAGGTELSDAVIQKYAALSRHTCVKCGKPATKITRGYISPYCDDCCPGFRAVPVDEYEREVSEHEF